MLIDCDTCTVRGDACEDCVVSFLTISVRPGAADPADAADVPREVAVDPDQVRALAAMSAGGLVPPLRHAALTNSAR